MGIISKILKRFRKKEECEALFGMAFIQKDGSLMIKTDSVTLEAKIISRNGDGTITAELI